MREPREVRTKKGKRDNEPPTCIKCGDEYLLPDGYEVTDYCDPCAQEVVLVLRAALEDIAEPMKKIQSDAKAQGGKVEGVFANALCQDANWLRDKARTALREIANAK